MGKQNKILATVVVLLLMTALAGCASMQSGIHDLHGSIVGNEYYIDTFDNSGIRTMRTHGKKIDIDNNIVEEKTYSSSEEWYTTKTLSSVITITIDGKQLISCGDNSTSAASLEVMDMMDVLLPADSAYSIACC